MVLTVKPVESGNHENQTPIVCDFRFGVAFGKTNALKVILPGVDAALFASNPNGVFAPVAYVVLCGRNEENLRQIGTFWHADPVGNPCIGRDDYTRADTRISADERAMSNPGVFTDHRIGVQKSFRPHFSLISDDHEIPDVRLFSDPDVCADPRQIAYSDATSYATTIPNYYLIADHYLVLQEGGVKLREIGV